MNPIHAEWLAIDRADDLHRDAAGSRLLAAAASAAVARRRPRIDLGSLRALAQAARERARPLRGFPVETPPAASSPPPGSG